MPSLPGYSTSAREAGNLYPLSYTPYRVYETSHAYFRMRSRKFHLQQNLFARSWEDQTALKERPRHRGGGMSMRE